MKMKSLLTICALALAGLAFWNAPQQAQEQKKHNHHTAQPAAPEVETELEALGVKDVAVGIRDSKFSPKTLKIKAGTKVTWTNSEAAPHTVTADKAEFESGNLSNGQSYSFTFGKPGTYKYHCNYHGGSGGEGMAGTVKVVK
jgi:plastocyanin